MLSSEKYRKVNYNSLDYRNDVINAQNASRPTNEAIFESIRHEKMRSICFYSNTENITAKLEGKFRAKLQMHEKGETTLFSA